MLSRSPSGAGRDRTDDPRLAKPVLSQLSYSPRASFEGPSWRRERLRTGVVGLARLELATSPLSGVRSNHLSYSPVSGLHCFKDRPSAQPNEGQPRGRGGAGSVPEN